MIDISENNIINSIHKELLFSKQHIYDKCGLECSDIKEEIESSDYGAYNLKINNMPVKFRVAKITPTKTGQFVTLWKRSDNGPIEPFHISDNINLFIITVRDKNHFGQFIFPKSVLYKKGIISDDNKEGKRAIRIYPPWDKTTSTQANKTQMWQLEYFLEISGENRIDLTKAKRLLEILK